MYPPFGPLAFSRIFHVTSQPQHKLNTCNTPMGCPCSLWAPIESSIDLPLSWTTTPTWPSPSLWLPNFEGLCGLWSHDPYLHQALGWKPGEPPEKQQLRRPPLGGPPLFGNLKVNIGGIFYTQTLEVQLAAFFMAWYQEPAFFLKWSFIIVQKEPPKCFLVFNGVADYMGFLKVTIDFRRSVSKRHNQLPALRFDSNLWRNDVFGAFCLL